MFRRSIIILAIGLSGGVASATTLYVSSHSGNDANGGTATAPLRSIGRAVELASSGDEIRIAGSESGTSGSPPTPYSATCVYTGTGTGAVVRIANKALTLVGGFAYNASTGAWTATPLPSLVDGENARRCGYVTGEVTNRIELLEFANGSAEDGGCVCVESGTLTLLATPIHNGRASRRGGGLYVRGADLSVSLGAYTNHALLPELAGMVPVYSNSATDGGGIYLDGGTPVFSMLGAKANFATNAGGALFVAGGAPSIVGGAVPENAAGNFGGGIYCSNTLARIAGLNVSDNEATFGGGFYLDGPFAFSSEAATLIANNYVMNNLADEDGGGFYLREANVGIVNNVVAENDAFDGAAAYLTGSSPRFLENTMADNFGDSGIYVRHESGAGRWVVVHTWFGTYSNYVAGIPIPSRPTFTNNVVVGHDVGVYVELSGNGLFANKATFSHTLWWDNATDSAGPGAVAASDNLYANPDFANSSAPYHLSTNSPAIDAGAPVALVLPGTDLLFDIDGQARPSGAGMDLGADEVVSEPLSVWLVPGAVTREVKPGAAAVTNVHHLLNSGTEDDTYDLSVSAGTWSASVSPSVVVLSAQSQTSVVVSISVPLSAGEGTTNAAAVTAISRSDTNRTAVAADVTIVTTNAGESSVHYVWKESLSPQPPYATPETAAHVLQDAVDVARSGETVRVYPGIYDEGGRSAPGYALSNRVCVTNDVLVESLSGSDETFVVGAPDPFGTNGPSAVRGAWLADGAVLSGFTVMDGHTRQNASVTYDECGGGVLLLRDALLTNCVVKACTASTAGGDLFATHRSRILDAELLLGSCDGTGGGAYLYDQSAIERSRVSQNRAAGDGGGLYLRDYSFAGRCTVQSNRTDLGSGGGVWASVGGLVNLLLTDNRAAQYGGGVLLDGAALTNCTVVGNAVGGSGGGAYATGGGAEIVSTILYGNTGDDWSTNAPTHFDRCCATPAPPGDNFSGNPLFAGGNDYRLTLASPCVDAAHAGPSVDLDGAHRPMDGNADGRSDIDVGCYETENLSGDSDEDGMSDGAERVADTDPYDATDYFRIKALERSSGVSILRFDSSPERDYLLYACDNLVSGNWQIAEGPRPGVGEDDAFTESNAAPRRFYRLEVEVPAGPAY